MNKTEIKKLISKYSEEQLRELICFIMERNTPAQRIFFEYCKKQETKNQTENYVQIVKEQIGNCWHVASEIIEEFNMYGGGPEEEENRAYEELEKMQKLFEDNKLPWQFKETIFKEIMPFVIHDNSGFGDYLMDLLMDTVCVTKEEQLYLADYLVQNCKGYYHDIGTRIYLDYGKQEKYLAVRKENLVYASDYLELAQYYRKQKNEKLALQIVKEGLEKAQGGLSEIYRYLFEYYKNRKEEAELEKLYKNAKKRKQNLETLTELMYQYYKENGNYSKKKETLFCLMEGSYLDWKKLYERCVRELTKEDFEKEEVHILEKIKKNDLSTYFDIELEKGKTKELLQYLKKTGSMGGFYGIDREHYFSKRLEKVYPRDIVELYWQETERYVSWGKRENYQAAVGNLAVISRMMKENHWEEEWKQRYQDFKEKNKRKRLLMELL